MGRLFVVGMGPGDRANMTEAAYSALQAADVLCGYTAYVDLALALLPHKESYATGMGGELERCAWAVEAAAAGRDVALVCSGDAGVYGLAGVALQLAQGNEDVHVEVVPGVTAALSGAAVLGAPLANDYCTISLSDYLTPWETIEHRLRCAGEAGLCICLYNPASTRRPDHLRRACDILLETRDGDTACGWVRNIGREGQAHRILTLAELRDEQVDMFTTVFVGAPSTVALGDRLVTPRGYPTANGAATESSDGVTVPQTSRTERPRLSPAMRILVFGGTTEGRVVAQRLADLGHRVTASVATQLGAEELTDAGEVEVLVGRRDACQMAGLLAAFDLCVDATHPYATEASANIRDACKRTGTPLRRIRREPTKASDCIAVSSAREAARLLRTTDGAILVTTGAKELESFAGIDPTRLVARMLPTHEGLAACEDLGIPHANIVAMQGPFSQELNEALMRQHRIRWLVTKDGGRAGGMPQKLAAARACDVRTVLISRPKDEGMSVEELIGSIGEVRT